MCANHNSPHLKHVAMQHALAAKLARRKLLAATIGCTLVDKYSDFLFINQFRLGGELLDALHRVDYEQVLKASLGLRDKDSTRKCPVWIIKADYALGENPPRELKIRPCLFTKHFNRGDTFWPTCQYCGNESRAHGAFMLGAWKRLEATGIYYLGDHPNIPQSIVDCAHNGARAFKQNVVKSLPNALKTWELSDLISYYRSGYATSTLAKKASTDSASGRVLGLIEAGKLDHVDHAKRQELVKQIQALAVTRSQLTEEEKLDWLRKNDLAETPVYLVTKAERLRQRNLSANMKCSAYKHIIKSRLVAGLTQVHTVYTVDPIAPRQAWDANGGKGNKETSTAQAFKAALAAADEATK